MSKLGRCGVSCRVTLRFGHLAILLAAGVSVYGLWRLDVLSERKPGHDESAVAAVLQLAVTYQELFKDNERLRTELDKATASAQRAEIETLKMRLQDIELRLQNLNRELNKGIERLDADPTAYGGVASGNAGTARPVGECVPAIGSVSGSVTITCPRLDPSVVETLRRRLQAGSTNN